MEGEREKTRDQNEGSGQQQPIGQDREREEFDQTGEQPRTGSEPPRSMGTRGTEFGQFGDATGPSGQQGQSGTGQADLGSQAGATLAGRTDQQDLGIDQPGRVPGAGSTGTTGEGFVGAQGEATDEYLQERGSSGRATEGTDFAPQGRGALEGEEEDVEGGQRRSPRSDIEQE